MEVDVGSWSGLTRDEIEARYPDGYRRWLDKGGWEDGETYDEAGREGRVRVARDRGPAPGRGRPRGHTVGRSGRRSRLWQASGSGARRSLGVVENCAVVRLAVREGASALETDDPVRLLQALASVPR